MSIGFSYIPIGTRIYKTAISCLILIIEAADMLRPLRNQGFRSFQNLRINGSFLQFRFDFDIAFILIWPLRTFRTLLYNMQDIATIIALLIFKVYLALFTLIIRTRRLNWLNHHFRSLVALITLLFLSFSLLSSTWIVRLRPIWLCFLVFKTATKP